MGKLSIFAQLAILAQVEASALMPIPGLVSSGICQNVQQYVPQFPIQQDAVAAFCTNYFQITPSTVTSTQIAVITEALQNGPQTTTVYGITTVIATPTQGGAASGPQTCFQNTAIASPPTKAKRVQNINGPNIVDRFGGIGGGLDPLGFIRTACEQCNNIDFNPKVTNTVTQTSTVQQLKNQATKIIYTATYTQQAIVAPIPSSLNPDQTTYIRDNGTFAASNQQFFRKYTGYDFYGNDLYAGFCGNSGAQLNTPVGNFMCNGYENCIDVCARYNAANDKQGSKNSRCKGATFQISSTYCYLKYAVPGDGAPNCKPRQDNNDNSGLLLERPT